MAYKEPKYAATDQPVQKKAPDAAAGTNRTKLASIRKAKHVIFESNQILHWLRVREEAFSKRAKAFPKTLQEDYATRKNDVKLHPPSDVRLEIYKEYTEASIGAVCLFLYGNGWKEKAETVAAGIDWGKVRYDANTMISLRGGAIKPKLSDGYLTMVAVLSDVMEQLVGVDRNLMLAIMTRETQMDHNNYSTKTGNKGICQVTRHSPLFSYVAAGKKNKTKELELEHVMEVALPEKQDSARAKSLLAGLFDTISVRAGRQGDLAMNMLAGALTYRYKFCVSTGEGELDYRGKPEIVGYQREAVEAYNGAPGRVAYAGAVEKYWQDYAGWMAMIPRKKGDWLSLAGR
jgi:hypothetical protein